MNMAKARRRWMKWRRWENQVIALCGDAHKGLPGELDAFQERVIWYGYRRRRALRCNRRSLGWRKQGR